MSDETYLRIDGSVTVRHSRHGEEARITNSCILANSMVQQSFVNIEAQARADIIRRINDDRARFGGDWYQVGDVEWTVDPSYTLPDEIDD